ncbi:MAG: FAD-binding oxidoreductase [Dehalococcoidia bacterium]|nr:FAD-binding oxidoreductase [Dehalococcoidia bacterium]
MTATSDLEGVLAALPRARHRETSAYPIEGRFPSVALRPESPDGVARVLAAARDARAAVVPQGARTALTLGRPVSRYDVALDTTGLHRIVEYEPADMTVTVEAGVTLHALQARLAEEGQYLSVDPPPGDEVTIGGLLATARAGAWRGLLPGVRDLVLGITVATPEGTLVSSGGRVVKNVTGYDLHRLHTGALGSLGVIVSASFKVAPLPEATAMLALRCPDIQLAERAAFELRDRRLPLRALSLLDASTATTVGVETRAPATTVLAAFEGVPAVVARAERESRDVARRMRAAIEAVPPFTWSALRRRAALAGSEEQTVLVRLGVPPSRVASTLAAVGSGRLEAWAHVAAGCVYVRGASLTAATLLALQADAHAAGGFLQVEHAPAELRDIGDAGDLELTRTLKATFDPEGVLNPGRWGDDA